MQGQARGLQKTNYKGNLDCFKQVHAAQGFKGFTYGLIPNIMRNTVMNAVEMVAYDCAKDMIRNHTNYNSESTPMYIFYGFVAGFVG